MQHERGNTITLQPNLMDANDMGNVSAKNLNVWQLLNALASPAFSKSPSVGEHSGVSSHDEGILSALCLSEGLVLVRCDIVKWA